VEVAKIQLKKSIENKDKHIQKKKFLKAKYLIVYKMVIISNSSNICIFYMCEIKKVTY